MITKEILETQIQLYERGRKEAAAALEKVKADISAFNGAIEACQSLLSLNSELEAAQPEESSEEISKE